MYFIILHDKLIHFLKCYGLSIWLLITFIYIFYLDAIPSAILFFSYLFIMAFIFTNLYVSLWYII